MMFVNPKAQVSFTAVQTIDGLAPGRFRLSEADLGPGCYQANEPVVDLSGDEPNPVAVDSRRPGPFVVC